MGGWVGGWSADARGRPAPWGDGSAGERGDESAGARGDGAAGAHGGGADVAREDVSTGARGNGRPARVGAGRPARGGTGRKARGDWSESASARGDAAAYGALMRRRAGRVAPPPGPGCAGGLGGHGSGRPGAGKRQRASERA